VGGDRGRHRADELWGPSGVYSGTLGSGTDPVQATAYQTITARDITTSKSIDKPTFVQGQSVTYTIVVNVSEYRYSDATTITDTLPSGLCPIGTVNYDAHADSQCAPNGASQVRVHIAAENADGTFTLSGISATSIRTGPRPSPSRRLTASITRTTHDTTPTVGNDTLTNTETVTATSRSAARRPTRAVSRAVRPSRTTAR